MNWLSKLKAGLSKTSNKIVNSIDDLFNKRKLNQETALELEDILISTDIGADNAHKIVKELVEKNRFSKEISEKEIRENLAEIITKLLSPIDSHSISFDSKPKIFLMSGVNGNGKTTSIAKLANFYKSQGLKISLAACDTFRAAAVEQLQVWAKYLNIEIITGEENSDPASVAYKAVKLTIENKVDLLMIDTAGRLHNKDNLMAEFSKIIKVIKKIDQDISLEVILVLDATTGQNALIQLEKFHEIAPLSGIIMTKLDGTAKGGILVAIAQKYQIPVIALGVGESIDDLRPFKADDFAKALVGL